MRTAGLPAVALSQAGRPTFRLRGSTATADKSRERAPVGSLRLHSWRRLDSNPWHYLRRVVSRLTVLLFFSGMSALVYQVVWLRSLSLVFGVTVYAASTVLASFMAGLALGSTLGGRLSDRVRRPLVWFGAAEMLIGVTALLSAPALDAITSVYVATASGLTAAAPLTALRLLCSSAALLVPCTLMGATLPLALRAAISAEAPIAQRLSVLYFINTAGGVAGCLLAGFVLIGRLGMSATLRLAALNSLIVGVTAVLMAWRLPVAATAPASGARSLPAASPSTGSLTPWRRRVVLGAFALSGFTSLALEIVWFRTLVLYYQATTYAFTTMLAIVLTGIALGSLIAAPMLRRWMPALWWFGALHAAAGILAAAGARWLADAYAPATAASGLAGGAAVAILPTAVALGMAFPIGVRLWLASDDRAGRDVGLVYALNLAGAIAGSVVGGFVLLSALGSARSLAALVAASMTTGVLVLLADLRRSPRAVVPLLAVVIGLYAVEGTKIPDPFRTALTRRYADAGHVFMRDEGVQTTVSVHMRERGGRQLYLDGLHQASDGTDVVLLHRQIGHLPVLLHPQPSRALVIGLGGGATAGSVSLHPGLAVDVVELASGVVKAADWFTHINEDVTRRPNVRLHLNDARNHLLLGRGRYDVITADVIQPTHAGAGMLYSREYFTLARRALSERGVMVQWIGARSRRHYELIARTFQNVFPETTVWVNGALLIGSMQPLTVEPEALQRRFAEPRLHASLSAAGFPDAAAVLKHYVAGPAALRSFLGDGPMLTDDQPLLEYYLSLPRDDRPLDLDRLRREPAPIDPGATRPPT
jgi:spermidine synthase